MFAGGVIAEQWRKFDPLNVGQKGLRYLQNEDEQIRQLGDEKKIIRGREFERGGSKIDEKFSCVLLLFWELVIWLIVEYKKAQFTV
jgi:hypothetical protein